MQSLRGTTVKLPLARLAHVLFVLAASVKAKFTRLSLLQDPRKNQ